MGVKKFMMSAGAAILIATVTVTGFPASSPVLTAFAEDVASPISSGTFSITNTLSDQTYDGAEKTPAVSVVYKATTSSAGVPLTQGVDYQVSYANNTNATTDSSKATVKVSGTGKYASTLTATKNFNIRKAKVNFATYSNQIAKSYTGGAIEITDSDYRVLPSDLQDTAPQITYSSYNGSKLNADGMPVDAGTYSFTVKYDATLNTEAYSHTFTGGLQVSPVSLTREMFSIPSGTYYANGKKWQPEVTVNSGYSLTKDKDYTVSYGSDNMTAGTTGYVYINGKGNYAGSNVVLEFKIEKNDISKIDASSFAITIPKDSYGYTGKEIKPEPAVKYTPDGSAKASTLTKGKDYTVSYSDNVEPGTAAITITGIGNYKNSKTVNFTITKNELSDSNVVISAIPAQTYIGKDDYNNGYTAPIRPSLTVKKGSQLLKEGLDYTVHYVNNTKIGTAKAIIQAVSDATFTGSKEKSFQINKRTIKSGDVELSFTSREYTGSNITPDVTVKQDIEYKDENGRNVDSTCTLVNGTDYTVRYSNNSAVGTATVDVIGIGNYTGTVSKKFQITEKDATDISGAKFSTISDRTYNGSEQKPTFSVTLQGKILASSNYTVSYSNNVNYGTATITIIGKGKYKGSASTMFRINQANISAVQFSGLSAQKYTGSPVEPTITASYQNKILVQGKDYQVSFRNNINKGTGEAVITGIRNFTGTITKTFSITEKGSEGDKKVWASSFVLPGRNSLLSGATTTLTPALTPENANTYTIRWNTSNPDFVFVDGSTTNTAQTTDSKGVVVKANKEGSTVISAELFDENSKSLGKQYTLLTTSKTFVDVGTGYSTNAINTLANYGYVTGSGATQEFHRTPVINGTGKNTFTPGGDVKRADFVLMLYNKAAADYAAGRTTVDPGKASASPFSDVSSSAYYAQAINWAVANEITNGKGDGIFDPNGTVTRAEAVTFLQRYRKGSDAVSAKFTDVNRNAYYAGAVGWAVANGVTDGTSATTFHPNQKCSRAQAATFIYRAAF